MKIFLLTLLLSVSWIHAEEHWNQFRGPLGTGHSADTDVLTQWDESSVVWKTKLSGAGQSSPVNWGDQLFVTSANETGTERTISCLDRKTGAILWEQFVTVDFPETPHKMNSWATPSCAVDQDVVIAFFGPGGIHAYDLNGKNLWSKEVGNFPGPWGIGASPIILNDRVIQNCDAEGSSNLIALDKLTGETIWKTKRPDLPRGGWSTPILIAWDGQEELILNGEFGAMGYEPQTGEELWNCEPFNGRGSPVPDFAHGKLFVVSGQPGDTYTVRPGGRGNVTETHRVWNSRRHGGRDLPSPAVVGDFLLISSLSGILTCYDAITGETYFTERLDGEIAASPLIANGLVYLTKTTGETLVVRPGKVLDIVSRNPIGAGSDEIFRATLAPIQGQLFTRSQNTVYCIGQ